MEQLHTELIAKVKMVGVEDIRPLLTPEIKTAIVRGQAVGLVLGLADPLAPVSEQPLEALAPTATGAAIDATSVVANLGSMAKISSPTAATVEANGAERTLATTAKAEEPDVAVAKEQLDGAKDTKDAASDADVVAEGTAMAEEEKVKEAADGAAGAITDDAAVGGATDAGETRESSAPAQQKPAAGLGVSMDIFNMDHTLGPSSIASDELPASARLRRRRRSTTWHIPTVPQLQKLDHTE